MRCRALRLGIAASVALVMSPWAVQVCPPLAQAQPPMRRDIVASFSSGMVVVEVGDHRTTAPITRGTLSMSSDNAYCVPASGENCLYTVHELSLFSPHFTVLGQDFDRVHLVNSEPAPDQVDDGSGLHVRPVLPFWVLGRTQDVDFGVFTVPQDGDALDILDLIVTPGENHATLFGRITGQIERYTVRLTIMATVDSPFENTPPVADAGPDVSAATSCIAELDLDSSGTFDPNDNLMSSWWSIGRTAVGVAGEPVALPPGEYDLTLSARDQYGGVGTDVTHVHIADDGTSPPLPGMHVVRFDVPQGTDPERFAISASEHMTLQPAAGVSSPEGTGAPVASLGALDLGVGVHVGDAYVVSDSLLHTRAWIEGTLHTSGGVSRGHDSRIDGGVVDDGPFVPGRTTSFYLPAVPAGADDVVVEAGRYAAIDPGAYDHIVLQPRAQLELAPGLYSVGSLRVGPGAQLVIGPEEMGAPTILGVIDAVEYHGGIRAADGGFPSILVAYLGTDSWTVHTAFDGWIVAPNAEVVLGRAEHEGAFVARDVRISPFARVVHRPLSWDFVRRGRSACAIEPQFECIRDLGDGRTVARFGYFNRLPHYGAVVPLGPFNRLSGADGTDPPQGFWPREVAAAFEVEIIDEVMWVLGGHTAVATREGARCAE